MRDLRTLRAAAVVWTVVLLGCQDTRELTPPDLAQAVNLTLTVTGAGTGSGKVTAPAAHQMAPLVCAVTQGTVDPTECTKSYPVNSSLELTAQADAGSSFSGWSGACAGTASTCTVVMDHVRSVQATFDGGGPASFTLNIVGGGTGSGTVRSQAGLTPAIDCTITAGNATVSGCSASYASGTAVSLTATPTSGNDFTGWSGDCSGTGTCGLTITAGRSATASFSAQGGPEATLGRWDAPLTTPVVGIHLNLLRNGRLLLWGHQGEPYTWNPAGGGFTQVANGTCSGTNCELFCSGHTFMADGSLLVAGGHNEALGDENGLSQASIFNGTSWQATASMRYKRWYPTLVTLDDGQIVAFAGSQQPGVPAAIPERWNGSTWTELTGANAPLPFYPRAFVEPKSGRIFLAGDGHSRYLIPTGLGGFSTATLANGGARVVPDRDYGSAVILDSKVLYVGGGGENAGNPCPALPENTAEMIDLAAGNPTWGAVASMAFRRRQANATILPDGQVLVTGGTSSCGSSNEAGAVFAAELYAPPPVNRWTTMASASVVRVYHSTAALLPDGRVFVTGSGESHGNDQLNYQIFSPPYLFKGARPSYSLGSTSMRYGQPFAVGTPDAAAIRKVTIIRLGSTTHAFDMGQRLNTLNFTAGGTSLTLTPPANGRVAPPGPYMLFIVDDRGVPSVAQTILLGP